LWFKLPKNKSTQKTILNIIFIYLSTTILLVITLSFLYITNQKEQIFTLHQEQSKLQANYIIEQLEILHDNIENEIAIYPKLDGVESAIYDIDKHLIYSTFKDKIDILDKQYLSTNNFTYFIYKVEPYYLGSAYLVIKKETTQEIKLKSQKIMLIVFFIILFIIFTSLIIVKLLIKPLSDNLELLDRFIQDTTHELNTPISAILNNIEMLDTQQLDNKNLKKINRIKIGATTIATIYDDLSFLLLNNKAKSNNKEINITNVLNQRIDYFQIIAKSKKIDFIIKNSVNIFLYIDLVKIERLIDNLISNSIKYSHPNSKIIITLNHGLLSIEDFGIGMSRDEISNIFTRYQRFNTVVGGFGIGYSIIYNIIKEYNISLSIDSIKNQGTKVTLKW